MFLILLAASLMRIATAGIELISSTTEVAVSEENMNKDRHQSFCHKVIPLQKDSITLYHVMTNITEIEISVFGVMNLYLRQGQHKGELEAIFKNVNFSTSCFPKICTESVTNDVERMQERMTRYVMSVHCFENGTFRAWYPKKGIYDNVYQYEFSEALYWMPFRYDRLKYEALKLNKTTFQKPALGVNSQFQCLESFNFEYDNDSTYEINSYSNDTACVSYPPGRIFSHTLYEVLSNDFTVKKWNSNFTRTALLALRRTLASAELKEFLSVAKHKRIFENHNIPKSLKTAALDLGQLFRFKEGFDVKMKMKSQVWGWNLEVDLFIRSINNPNLMVIRAIPLQIRNNTDTLPLAAATSFETAEADVQNIILKPAISGFNASGVFLFDFLGDIQLKHLAPRHNINLILKSIRVDIDAIERIRESIKDDSSITVNFTTNFTVPWSEIQGIHPAQHKINCNETDFCTIDMEVYAEFTLLDVKSTYEVNVRHRLNKTDLKVDQYEFRARIADEGKFDVTLIDLEINFVEHVARNNTDKQFMLYGNIIDNDWFTDKMM